MAEIFSSISLRKIAVLQVCANNPLTNSDLAITVTLSLLIGSVSAVLTESIVAAEKTLETAKAMESASDEY